MTRLNHRLTCGLAAIYLFLNPTQSPQIFAAETPVAAARAANAVTPPPLLWKIEGPRPSWLFGTIHTDDPRVATLPAAVTAALAASRSFHPELALDADLGPALAAKLFQPDTPDLATVVPPALWRRVTRAGAALGLPAEMLARLTPAFAALLFSAPPMTDVSATLDGQLYTRAQMHGLAVAALETVDEQLGIFAQLPRADALAALTEALDEIEAGRPHEKKLLAAYAGGNERAIAALVAEEFSRSPAGRALAEPLLYARNRAMADRLAPHLKTGGAFVAIGAGHLCGARSVIDLLRARGWKVTRVAAP
jgi:uncharacterized protein YbaP (TraB family)